MRRERSVSCAPLQGRASLRRHGFPAPEPGAGPRRGLCVNMPRGGSAHLPQASAENYASKGTPKAR